MNVSWTQQEFEFVLNNLRKLSIDEIAMALNKTPKSVRRKMEREGVKKGSKELWTEDDQKILEENFHRGITFVISILDHKSRNTVLKKFYEYKKFKAGKNGQASESNSNIEGTVQ